MSDLNGYEKFAQGLGSAIETVPAIYDDGLKPTTQAVGKTIAIIPQTINAVLAPLRKWIANKEYNVAETEKLLADKLANVSPDKIVSPEAYVAVPAIQAISYSMDSNELRELYANLLASAMNSDTKESVHPAFVEVIKQLSPTDARILSLLPKTRYYPCIDIVRVYENGGTTIEIECFTQIQDTLGLLGDEALTAWNNIERLKIIDRPIYGEISSPDVYHDLENHPLIKSYLEQNLPIYQSYEIQKRYLEITNFGLKFIETCVDANINTL